MADLLLQFSRAAPPTWSEMWRDKIVKDASICICRITHSPFSHVDLVLDDGNLLGASDNPYAPVLEGNARGVAVRPPNYQKFAIRRIARLHAAQPVKADFVSFCKQQIGKPFDNSALSIREFLSPEFSNRDWREDKAWYCAEMLGRAVEVSRLISWAYPGIKGRLTAADLLNYTASLIDFDEFLRPIPGLKLDPGEV